MSNVNKCKAQSKERVEREPMDQAQTQRYVIEVRAPSSTFPPSTHEGFPLSRPPRTLYKYNLLLEANSNNHNLLLEANTQPIQQTPNHQPIQGSPLN